MEFDFQELMPEQQESEVLENKLKKESKEQIERDDSLNPWLWNGEPIEHIPQPHETFVYLFTNKINGKQYIGFKTAVSVTTKSVKGKKKRMKVESDWKNYFSSSQELLKDVGKYGTGAFIREIVALTVNKSIGKYYEAYYQFTKGVLTDNSDRYYNGIVNLRINQNGLKKFKDVVFCDKVIGNAIYYEFHPQDHQALDYSKF